MNLKSIKTLEELKLAKANFYKDGGELKNLQLKIRNASSEEKIILGKKITDLKNSAENAFLLKAQEIENDQLAKKLNDEWIDVTTPVVNNNSLHPLTIVSQKFKEWFSQNGYYESNGGEIEEDEFNFQRLNIGVNHPARDMQDSLYVNTNNLLRTHNTGFSARELEKNANKSFSSFAIGKVYRNDEDDQTHSHQFIQADLVSVGYFSFNNLIYTLKSLLSYVLEENIELRLRPSFFPFTEPSVEVDIFYKNKWIEVLGSGILNEKVLKAAGYTNDMNGFAAGIGIERIAMIKYGIQDIREFYKNDLRFLNQFKEVK